MGRISRRRQARCRRQGACRPRRRMPDSGTARKPHALPKSFRTQASSSSETHSKMPPVMQLPTSSGTPEALQIGIIGDLGAAAKSVQEHMKSSSNRNGRFPSAPAPCRVGRDLHRICGGKPMSLPRFFPNEENELHVMAAIHRFQSAQAGFADRACREGASEECRAFCSRMRLPHALPRAAGSCAQRDAGIFACGSPLQICRHSHMRLSFRAQNVRQLAGQQKGLNTSMFNL